MPVGLKFVCNKLDHDEDGIYYFKRVVSGENGNTVKCDVKVQYIGEQGADGRWPTAAYL
jgi:hypothetical protein